MLPDGKRIYPPCLHGQPIDELALALLDMHDPAQSTFLRLIGPPGAGKSQIARAIAYRLWTGRGREVDRPPRRAVLRVRRAAARPVLGRVLLPLRLRPGRRRRRAGGARRLGVRAGDARGLGGDDRRGQHRPRRRAALDQRHARRPPRAVPRRRPARPSIAQPGFAVLLAYNPGLVGATDIPDAWHSRFPATLEVTSNWAALAAARRAGAARARGDAPRPPADRRRGRADAGRRSSATSNRCGG